MAEEQVYLTHKGLEDLKKEYEHMTTVKRLEIADAIQKAREYGDLSENAEYENAKNQQAFIEGRISQLEKMIANAVIIDSHKSIAGKKIVQIGSTVEIMDPKLKEQTYTIVGTAESDPLKGKISNASPLGNALLGHKEGDKVKVPTPGGVKEVDVLKIS